MLEVLIQEHNRFLWKQQLEPKKLQHRESLKDSWIENLHVYDVNDNQIQIGNLEIFYELADFFADHGDVDVQVLEIPLNCFELV